MGGMALLNDDVFEAFKSAAADDEKRRKAAEALADAARASEVAGIRSDVFELKSTVRLHTWMLSFNTAMLVAVLWRVFSAA